MPIYANIGGSSKQLTYYYANVGGTNKALSTVYSNIGGSNKIIFEGKKKHWWKRYDVTSWELKKGYSQYNSETDRSDDLTSWGYADYWNFDSYLYANYNFSTSSGKLYATNAKKAVWIADPDNGTGDNVLEQNTYIYNLDSSFKGYYADSHYSDSNSYYTSILYHVNYAYIMFLYASTDGSLIGSGVNLIFDYFIYPWPSAHSYNYTLVSSDTKYYSSSIPSNGYYMKDINNDGDGGGYGVYDKTDDRDETYAYGFDGYYWQYDGYYM